MESKTLFAKTPPVKLFFYGGRPGSGQYAGVSSLSDGGWHFCGTDPGRAAFAALNLAMPFVIINFSLADLIGVGSSVPISINLGRKEEKKANNIFTAACLLILLAGILMGAVLYAAAPLLIRLMGAEGELAKFAVQYLRVYALLLTGDHHRLCHG